MKKSQKIKIFIFSVGMILGCWLFAFDLFILGGVVISLAALLWVWYVVSIFD